MPWCENRLLSDSEECGFVDAMGLSVEGTDSLYRFHFSPVLFVRTFFGGGHAAEKPEKQTVN